MLKKFSYEQMEKLLHHVVGINSLLTEVLTSPQMDESFESEPIAVENFGIFAEQTKTKPILPEYAKLDLERKNYDLSRLCGRWMTSKSCGIEISRAGEHFILTYLKRNGTPTDERYILMWLDGDILYYGHQDRMTMLALNTQSDTLMISPGVDYTRIPQDEIK